MRISDWSSDVCSSDLQLGGGGLRDLAAVCPHQHGDRTEHHFLAVLGCRAGTQLWPFADLGYVSHADRQAVASIEHDAADFVETTHLSRHAYQVLLPVALDIARAHVLVVGGHRIDDVMQGETQRAQLRSEAHQSE